MNTSKVGHVYPKYEGGVWAPYPDNLPDCHRVIERLLDRINLHYIPKNKSNKLDLPLSPVKQHPQTSGMLYLRP